MSDIFREVDEALSREKVAKFWKEYGKTLAAAAVIMVVSTAATTAYMHWDSHRNKQATSKLLAATTAADASAIQEAAQDTGGTHKAIALMSAATKLSAEKDFKGAADTYLSVAEDRSAPDEISDLAAILYTRAAVLAADGGAADYKSLIEKLTPVTKDSKSAFQAQAKLEAALLYGDGLKDYTAALGLLNGLEEQSLPDSLKEKAAALAHVYRLEQSSTKAQE